MNGIKNAVGLGKMASYYNKESEGDVFEEKDMKIIEEVKPFAAEDGIRFVNHTHDVPRNNVNKNHTKTGKMEIGRKEMVTKPVTGSILWDLQDLLPNGQSEPSLYRKPELLNSFSKEVAEVNNHHPHPLVNVEAAPAQKSGEAVDLMPCDEVKPAVAVEKKLTPEELRSIKLRNNNVRQLIYKEVKRPGKCHNLLWKMLEELHGPPWVRKQFIREVKQEAIR